MKSKLIHTARVSDDYIQSVLDLAHDIARACRPLFDDKDSNLIINAINNLHAQLIFIISERNAERAIQAAEMEAESLILNVKHLCEREDNGD
jgi:hypothetical protein